MVSELTVITPVYVNVPERWEFFRRTIESFQKCCLFKGTVHHYVLDDRSPLCEGEIRALCSTHGLRYLGRTEEGTRRGFYDVIKTLLDSVTTEFVMYLEGDHYFYLPYDFVTPAITLHGLLPDLHQLFLRAPITYDPFLLVDDALITYDKSRLFRVKIDDENTGWVGTGENHESFSMMPSVFKTEVLRRYFSRGFIPGLPWQIELVLAQEWQHKKLVGYLNAQAFCYHIGGAGKVGTGGFLEVGDSRYEAVWSKKIL